MRASATGRVLNDPLGRSFRFDAGAVCRDFAHTGGEGRYAVFHPCSRPVCRVADPYVASLLDLAFCVTETSVGTPVRLRAA
jgi:hypothetical protein